MTSEEITERAGSALTRWGPTIMSGLLTIALFIMGYWLNGQAAAQAAFNDRLSRIEQAVAGAQSDVRDVINTINLRGAARDQQFATISNQAGTLSARVDRIENAFGDKLDKVITDISTIRQDISAIKAVAGLPKR